MDYRDVCYPITSCVVLLLVDSFFSIEGALGLLLLETFAKFIATMIGLSGIVMAYVVPFARVLVPYSEINLYKFWSRFLDECITLLNNDRYAIKKDDLLYMFITLLCVIVISESMAFLWKRRRRENLLLKKTE